MVERRYQDVIQAVFQDLGGMSVFVPKFGLFKSRLLWMYNEEASSPELQHIAIDFVHEDQGLEQAGVLSLNVVFSESQATQKPILYFSLRLSFLPSFGGSGIILYGQEEMIKIIRERFEAMGDQGISVYFEHCNKFDYHKAALKAGSIPGWVYHRRSSGKNYSGIKGHLLYIMDQFLHYDSPREIPYEALARAKAKVFQSDGMTTLLPRPWEGDRLTTISFVPIWNCNPCDVFVYDMEGEFFMNDVPEATKDYIQEVKKYFPRNVINAHEVRAYLRDNKAFMGQD
ncbi:MAG: hypothetical protein K2L24_02890 [Opitutales bacterium]|nr:hypothetical protein [Opitutales bacterium]